MNVLVPMAGEGSRFRAAGYKLPKPLVDVCGKPMIERVIENIGGPDDKFIFVVQLRHVYEHSIDAYLRKLVPNCEVVTVDGPTSGAACTALLAEKYINNSEPLLIANSDQIVEGMPPAKFLGACGESGRIYTFEASDPKWSYAAVDDSHFVWGVAEKQVISRRATCGIYWWASGDLFVRYARKMIAANRRVNNEFYIAPVYNEAIADNHEVREAMVARMWGLGTPEDLREYERTHLFHFSKGGNPDEYPT